MRIHIQYRSLSTTVEVTPALILFLVHLFGDWWPK